jgi:hypothetical protein
MRRKSFTAEIAEIAERTGGNNFPRFLSDLGVLGGE